MHAMDNKTLPPPAQSSIRSFFKPKSPSYASLPVAGPPKSSPTTTAPPSTTAPPPPTASPSQQTPPPTTTATTTATQTPLHPSASITPILPSHIPALKRINALLLCITYPTSFYTNILQPTPPPSFSRAILWTPSTSASSPPALIGGVVCRIEPSPSPSGAQQQLYIQSLALLSPYRHLGLATAALDSIITSIITTPLETPITSLYAHVWTENTEGLEWYKARGFEVEGGEVEGYYRKLTPDTAWVLRRRLGAADYLKYGSGSAQANGSAVSTNGAPPPPQTQTQAKTTELPTRPPPKTASSYQTTGPGMEWNDLPTDILLPSTSRSRAAEAAGGGVDSSGPPSSAVSSRSSSVVAGSGVDSGASARGGKKKRVYPAAAFGS